VNEFAANGVSEMEKVNRYISIVTLMIIFAARGICFCAPVGPPDRVEVVSENKIIKIGEPLIVKMKLIWEDKNIVESDRRGLNIFSTLEIERRINDKYSPHFRIGYEASFRLEAGSPATYSTIFFIFYDFRRERLIFSKPGLYIIKGRASGKMSEPLEIEVKPPSQAEKNAIELLTDPNDYGVLMFGVGSSFNRKKEEQQRLKAIETLKKVFNRNGNSVIGRWAAARVGIELYEQLDEKYRGKNVDKVMEDYRTGKIKEPLVDEAHRYLSAALELPDSMIDPSGEFHIRENVLYALLRVEQYKGNYQKCLSYLDELIKRYPEGRFSRRVQEANLRLFFEQLLSKQNENTQTETNPLSEQNVGAYLTHSPTVLIAIIILLGLTIFLSIVTVSRRKTR